MKHFRIEDVEGKSCVAIPEEEYIALTHYFGKTSINILTYIKRIGRVHWGNIEEFINQLPYKEEGL